MEPALTGLYPRLLGASWSDLPEVVRRLHSGGSRRAAGVFDVRHGRGLRLGLARLMGLPASGEAVPTVLSVIATPEGERWERRFGKSEFSTDQRAGGDGRLLERFGLLDLSLALRVEDGSLVYEPVGAGLRLFGVVIPVPRWLSPRVAGRVSAEGDEARVHVQVVAPLFGSLISYSGSVKPT